MGSTHTHTPTFVCERRTRSSDECAVEMHQLAPPLARWPTAASDHVGRAEAEPRRQANTAARMANLRSDGRWRIGNERRLLRPRRSKSDCDSRALTHTHTNGSPERASHWHPLPSDASEGQRAAGQREMRNANVVSRRSFAAHNFINAALAPVLVGARQRAGRRIRPSDWSGSSAPCAMSGGQNSAGGESRACDAGRCQCAAASAERPMECGDAAAAAAAATQAAIHREQAREHNDRAIKTSPLCV